MPSPRTLTIHCAAAVHARTEHPPPGAPGSAEAWVYFGSISSLAARSARFLSLLDGEELARADRFRFAQDRERFIAGHGLLRELLGQQLHRHPKDLVLLRGEFGKPFLEGDPLHFNLSDTKDAVLVAFSRQPIGADIETINRHTDHAAVANHYFTPAEVRSIATAVDAKRRFLELWTRKEAVLKACGVGLMDDLHSLEVNGPTNLMTITHPEFVRMAAPAYYVRTLLAGTDHFISVATAQAVHSVRLFTA